MLNEETIIDSKKIFEEARLAGLAAKNAFLMREREKKKLRARLAKAGQKSDDSIAEEIFKITQGVLPPEQKKESAPPSLRKSLFRNPLDDDDAVADEIYQASSAPDEANRAGTDEG